MLMRTHPWNMRLVPALPIALLASFLLNACDNKPSPPDIKFAPDNADFRLKVDLAEVEYKYPLSPADLAKITPENLAALSQEQIDQIYARLSAGPIPDGPFNGGILFPRGSSGKFRLSEIAGGLTSTVVELKGMALDNFGEQLWQGKVFFRNDRVLRNRIDNLDALKKLGLIDKDPKKTSIDGKEAWLLFPAKLYCGQSLLDSRRESIIVDYLFTDEIDGYQEKPDFLAGRRGVRVRDEIRMVRPGFYLGRAYLDRVFALNFTLYNKAIAERDGPAFKSTGQVNEDCWIGTQARAVAQR
jgi:hypothetical protein